jgi:hypothetical protein
MIELREKCLRALADFLQSSRLADGGFVSYALEEERRDATIPSDQYPSCGLNLLV